MSAFSGDDDPNFGVPGLDDWYDKAIAAGAGFKTAKEKEDYIASLGDPMKHPMFATSTEDLEGNPLVEAIRALNEEDKTHVELANMYKDEGNEWIKKSNRETVSKKKKKPLQDSYNCYTHALTFVDKADAARNDNEDYRDSNVDLNLLRSQIYSNRAQVSMLLMNYAMVVRDCELSLKASCTNMKAHYRKCKSLYMTKKYRLAAIACDDAIQIYNSLTPTDGTVATDTNTTNSSGISVNEITSIQTKSKTEVDKINQVRIGKLKKLQQENSKWTHIYNYCNQTLHVILGYRNNAAFTCKTGMVDDLDMKTTIKLFSSNSTSSADRLNTSYIMPFLYESKQYMWPVLFIYPQYNQIDAVQAVNIDDMLAVHLAEMFPEPDDQVGGNSNVAWDIKGEYHVSNLVAYIQLNSAIAVTSNEEWLLVNRHDNILLYGTDLYTDNSDDIHNNLGLLDDACDESLSYSKVKADREKQLLQYRLSHSHPEFVQVHVGCMIKQILEAKNHIIQGGLLRIYVYAKDNKCHADFLKENSHSIQCLQPNGKVTK